MRAWAAIITLGVLSLASFAMLYAVHLKAARGSGSSAGLEEFWAEAFPPIGGFAKTLWWLVTTHTGRLYSYPIGEKNFGSTLSFVLWILGIRALWKRPGGKWLLGVLLLPQALLLAAACLHLYPYGGHPRINLFLAPSMCLLIGAGLAHVSGFLKPAARRQWRTVAAALLLLLPIGEIGQGVYAAWSSSREPSIRDSLAQAAGELRPGNEVICLMDPASLNKGGPARQVFEYYARRTFGARARWVSELPPHVTTAGQSSGAKTLVIEYVSAERLGSSPDQNAATCNNRAPIVAQRPEAPCCTIVHGLKDQIRIWHYEGRADAGRSHDARTTSDDPAGRP